MIEGLEYVRANLMGEGFAGSVDIVDSVLAHLRASPAPAAGGMTVPDGWQPIETAPKDGSRFLAYCDGKVDFFHWQERSDGINSPIGWRDSFITVYREGTGPRHWMPIPSAPGAAAPSAAAPVAVDVDWLSNVIRAADGNNTLGAGALAEKIVEALAAHPPAQADQAPAVRTYTSMIHARYDRYEAAQADHSAQAQQEFVYKECAASGAGCNYGPHGPDGEQQCEYCGDAPAHAQAGEVALPVCAGTVFDDGYWLQNKAGPLATLPSHASRKADFVTMAQCEAYGNARALAAGSKK
jgi:hypothetical protein